MKDIVYWIWYALRCGAGSSDGVQLMEHYARSGEECPPKRIYEAGRDELLGIGKFDPSFISRFADHDLGRAEDIIEFCFMGGIRIVSCASEYYPKRLKNVYNRPIVLYCRGNIEALDDKFCVGVVGTRAMTNYGKHITFDFTRKLCAHNAVIISGAASGIDSVANQTALYFESQTIAVLGCGVNVAYPSENKAMLDRIAERGMIISELAPNTPPSRYTFPIRNRIISGLSDALLVVEAGEKSGALITARHAADQKRPVYAVPGNVNSPESRGTNLLIRDGAYLCSSAEDIIQDFAEQMKLSPNEMLTRSEKYLHYELRTTKPLPERATPGYSLSHDKNRPNPTASQAQYHGANPNAVSQRADSKTGGEPHADGRPSGNSRSTDTELASDKILLRDNLKPASALLKNSRSVDTRSNEAASPKHIGQSASEKPNNDKGSAHTADSASARHGDQIATDRQNDNTASAHAADSAPARHGDQTAADRPNDNTASAHAADSAPPRNDGARCATDGPHNSAASAHTRDSASSHSDSGQSPPNRPHSSVSTQPVVITKQESFDKSRLNPLQLRVYNLLPDDGSAVSPDKLTRDDLSTSDVLATLTILELYSAVESLPGGLFRRNI